MNEEHIIEELEETPIQEENPAQAEELSPTDESPVIEENGNSEAAEQEEPTKPTGDELTNEKPSTVEQETTDDFWGRLKVALAEVIEEVVQQNLSEKLDALSHSQEYLNQEQTRLNQTFDSKLKTDAEKNLLFERQYEELSIYKKGIYETLKKDIIQDIISEIDSAEKILTYYLSQEPSADLYIKLCTEWQQSLDSFNNILDKNDVIAYRSQVGDSFDPKIHRCFLKSETADINLDKTIKSLLRSGYQLTEGRIIRPEFVELYIYKEPLTDEVVTEPTSPAGE